jgi:hypothetical protein
LHAAFNTYAVCEEHHELLQRTRAALAEPEPEGPTAMEIIELANEIEAAGLGQVDLVRVRAALARWGNHPESPDSSPQPIPVSERLPGPEDCDAEGRCWWYGEGGDMVGWTLDAEGPSYYRAKYWLPAHALPVPAND